MSSVEWSVARRIAFRFGFVLAALIVFPFPIGTVPWTEPLSEVLTVPLDLGTRWFATGVLGLPDPAGAFTGSGDRVYDYVRLLLFVTVAALGAIAWSVIDRRRRAYPQLAAAAWVAMRYWVAWAMLSYGVSKILKSQFYDLSPGVMHQ